VTEPAPPPDDLGWRPDAPATEFLLGRGQIERVEPDPAHARDILDQAGLHLESARSLAGTKDVGGSFVMAHDAARKALVAMLAVQGLRAAGGDGGHRVLGELLQAQLPRYRRTIAEFDWMREKRDITQYPERGKPIARPRDVAQGLPCADEIVRLAVRFVEFVAAQAKARPHGEEQD
jgi:HEPN domain-containing protein